MDTKLNHIDRPFLEGFHMLTVERGWHHTHTNTPQKYEDSDRKQLGFQLFARCRGVVHRFPHFASLERQVADH